VPHPNRRNQLAAGLALLLLASLAGCQAAASLSLANREFLSNAITDGGAAFVLVPDTRVRLNFTDTSVSASADFDARPEPFASSPGHDRER